MNNSWLKVSEKHKNNKIHLRRWLNRLKKKRLVKNINILYSPQVLWQTVGHNNITMPHSGFVF